MVGSNGTMIAIRLVRSKLRKREEHSNSVHPADVVVQTGGATVVQIPPPALTSPTCPQDTITYRGQFLMSQYPPPPPPPYNLYSNDQNMLVQNLRNTERPGLVRGFRKNIGGHWQRLFKRKPEPEVYTIPAELKPQLKQIYVY